MSVHRSDRKKIFRTAFLGLLAGCLWFSTATTSFAQDNSSGTPSAQQKARTDADIQSDVGYALTHESTLQGQQITCTTANGTVTLSGTVQNNAQFQEAETVAGNVSGVSGIINNIKVANPDSPQPPPPDQATANSLAPGAEAAQANVPPPPPDQEPNGQPAPNQVQGTPNQAPPVPYMGARPPYQPQQGGYYPPQQSYNPPPPSGPVTIPAGTLLRVRIAETLDTAHLKSGTFFQATAAADVYQNGALAIPRGAVLTGQVVESKKPGDLGGSAELRLQLTNINLGGSVFPIATDIWSSKGPNKAGYTVGNTAGGAALGAIIGGIIGGGSGAAIGAGVGGVGGLAASSATNGPRLILPVESQVDFHLTGPVTVQPVSWQEAQRLASSVPQQPRLVQRPYRAPMYVAPYPYGPYPYAPYPYGPYPY
jgi:BON domain